jgi:phage terminase Nu1 subunit (DNA packaging protein)
MKVREYARHRGVSHTSIRKAILSGRLIASITYDDKKRPVVDRDKADAEWMPGAKEMFNGGSTESNELKRNQIDHDDLPDADPDDPIERKRIQKETAKRKKELEKAKLDHERAKADLAQLEVDEKIGKLVDASQVKSKWVNLANIVRTKIMGIPSKARQRIPEISSEQYVVLEAIVRETLEDLADN